MSASKLCGAGVRATAGCVCGAAAAVGGARDQRAGVRGGPRGSIGRGRSAVATPFGPGAPGSGALAASPASVDEPHVLRAN